MKRLIFILCFVAVSFNLSAQNDWHYLTLDYTVAGTNHKVNKSDFETSDFTFSYGYRFNDKWAAYIPITSAVAKYALSPVKLCDDQALLGLGVVRTLPLMSGRLDLDFDLSYSATYLSGTQEYGVAKFMVKVASGRQISKASPVIGVGVLYNHSYKADKASRLMLGVSIGGRIF